MSPRRWWIAPDGTRIPVLAGGTATFAITQAAYRVYNDDGGEATATAAEAENTAYTANVSTTDWSGHLRIRLDETGAGSASGAATDDYQLQVSKNGGAFANVTTTSANVKGFDSINLTDGNATTQRLTAGGGIFVQGKQAEDGLIDNIALTANNHTEHLWSVQVVKADVVNGDALTFRVLLNGATTNVTYTVTPTMNVLSSAGPTGTRFNLSV